MAQPKGADTGTASKTATNGKPRKHLLLGQVMLKEKLISTEQLREALDRQKQEKLRLGQMLVEMGVVGEAQVVKAINKHYQVELSSLAEDLESFLRHRDMMMEEKRRGLRMSIKAKLSIAIIFIIWITILSLSFVVLDRQRENLYNQTLTTGKVSLNYIANSARVPLLRENILELNTLVKEASAVEGVVYAVIVNRDNIVQAHTDPTNIRKKLALNVDKTRVTREGDYTYYNYHTPTGIHVLNISTPISFQNKVLGQADVGVSLDFIQHQINQETIYIIALSLLIIVLGIVISIFLGVGFSRPISALVVATRQIGQGNLKYRINKIRNDELGDLASAFNYMSSELWKKQLMQESFGKYVGSEVVELILADPENVWLKGTRSDATVLFTDIRGFTSYSEQRSPEAVVEMLNQYFDVATRNIREYGGYVDKFIGDAVMGVFGVPLPETKHVELAVRAALTMQQELAEAAVRTGNEVLARIGIGLNAGYVVSGNIGSQDKMEYTVIGDTVNVASRINALAGPGDVVISQSVYEVVKSKITVKPLAAQKVKGKTEPIQTYKVLSITDPATGSEEAQSEQQSAT